MGSVYESLYYYKCYFCKEKIDQPNIEEHFKTVHMFKSLDHICEFCDEIFDTQKDLIIHAKIHVKKSSYIEYDKLNVGVDKSGKRNNFGRLCKTWHELQSRIHLKLKGIALKQGRNYDCGGIGENSCPNFCNDCWEYFRCAAKQGQISEIFDTINSS